MVTKKSKATPIQDSSEDLSIDIMDELLATDAVPEILNALIENPEAGLDEEDIALMKALEAGEDEPVVEEVVEVMIKPKRKKNYVNNADLLIQYKLGREQERMTEEFAKMLQTIADRYGMKGSFRDYSYLEDMKAYAMMMAVRTWKSFNTEKSTNAFAFFTQCIKNSFRQYLKVERKARDVRDAVLIENGLNPSYTYSDGASEGGSDDSFGGASFYDY